MTHRGSIRVEDHADIISHQLWPGDQCILRLRAPDCAEHAQAGQFVHLDCGPTLRMRRPISIQRVDRERGEIELLYKIVGIGTSALSQLAPGDQISVLGPIGKAFTPDPARPHTLLLGGGVGMPPMIFLAETLSGLGGYQPLLLLGSEVPFPLELNDAPQAVPGLPATGLYAAAEFEAAGIASRLTSKAGLAGAYNGFLTDLARLRLQAMSAAERQQTMLFACGPDAMLRATATLAQEFDLPCQLSLEEFMACAVGGCAGCTVPVLEEGNTVMRRVCVDGPVFDAAAVFPPAP